MQAEKSGRARLTREAIETAALRLIEDEGFSEFSYRKLAKRLGCEPMSLYHHFPSKAHLLDALLDRVVAEAAPPRDGHWRERMTRLVSDYRAMAHRHPAFFQYMALHRFNTPGGLGWLEGALSLYLSLGLAEETAVRLFRVFGYYITGGLLDETAGYAKGPSAASPPSNEEIAKDYPAVVRAGRYFAADQFDATFELGLNLLLDGVEAAIKSSGGVRRPA